MREPLIYLFKLLEELGRENLPGKVIIQTYSPENFCIECSRKQNYDEFYKTEISLRKQLKYPPFYDIIMFALSSVDKEEIIDASNKLYKILEKNNNGAINIFKPVPSPIDRIKNRYRWRIILKCNLNNNIIDIINKSLEEYYKYKFKKTKVTVDTNPNNMN